jgi:hypothetical protein
MPYLLKLMFHYLNAYRLRFDEINVDLEYKMKDILFL